MVYLTSRKYGSLFQATFKNQAGSGLFACLVFILLVFGASVIFIKSTLQHERLLINHVQGYFCIQKFHYELEQHLKTMEKINYLISTAQVTSIFLALIPGLQTSVVTVQRIKNFLKTLQFAEVVSYQKKVWAQKNKGCPLPLLSPISPYTRQGYQVERALSELAIIRKKQWSYLYRLSLGRTILIQYKIRHTKLHTHSQAIL